MCCSDLKEKVPAKVARLNRISVFAERDSTLVTTSFEALRKLSDAKVAVALPEAGVSAKRNVDISGRSKKTVSVLLPFAAELEEFVRVVFHSDEGRRIKYVPLNLVTTE